METPTDVLNVDAAALHMWGKSPETTPYPLQAHLLDSWVTAGAVWDCWLRPGLRQYLADLVAGGDQALARRLVQTAAAWHDVGKVNPVFQTQAADDRKAAWKQEHVRLLGRLGLPALIPNQVSLVRSAGHPARRHEYISGIVLGGQTPEDLSLSENWLIQSITGHHGRWRSGEDSHRAFTERLMRGSWGDLAAHIAAEVVEWTGGFPDPPNIHGADATSAIILTAGLVVLADWIASLDFNVTRGRDLIDSGAVPGPHWVDARTEQLTESVRQALGWYISPPDPTAVVMGDKTSLRPLQSEAINTMRESGLWIVAYPTGEGKTEAALLRHMGISNEGLIFALPTRATTNAMQVRLDRIFANTGNQVILSHQFASRFVCATAGAEHGTEWYDSSIRRLVAPVVAATCDQVLSGALRGKHAALRLTALANKHVILDEVHTFDHYQSSLLTELLHWWGATDTRVTLLSATLPTWQQRDFEAAYRRGQAGDIGTLAYPGSRLVQPGAAAVDSPGAVSAPQPALATHVVSTSDPVDAHVEWVAAHRKQYPGAHLAVVVNTVDRAIAVARSVEQLATGATVFCLHSRFTLADRNAIEADLLARLGPGASASQPPVVLVGTQVIEASLDIDVDFMSTDICPAPSLLQRAGRCQRFRDPSARLARMGAEVVPKELQVVFEEDARPLPYLPGEIDRVASFLDTHPAIEVPNDVQRFVDDTTFDTVDWISYMGSVEGREEIGEAVKRLEAANESRAALSTGVLSRKKQRYGTLVTLTRGKSGDGDLIEDVMGTRYVDRPSAMYLLIPPSKVTELRTDRAAGLVAVDQSIPVNTALDRILQPASAALLARSGLNIWSPAYAGISMMQPVDPADLDGIGLEYDPHFGMRKAL